jgi:hypothetical protein
VGRADASGEPDESYAVQGDMPRGKQFGYLFTTAAEDLERLAAHELGHGIFTLRHTFDTNLLGSDSKGQTANLLDYGDGTELAVWQWNVMANPAPLTWFDDDEDGMLLDMETDRIWIKWTEVNKTPKRFLNKKHLFYTHRGIQRDGNDCSNSVYYKMTDGYIIRLFEECNTPEIIRKSELIISGEKPYPLFLSEFEEDRLGEDLINLMKQGGVEMGKIIGRYALPIEDGYILITGEDFDSNDADRIAAGGFIVLEAIQVGKIVRFVKGAKILSSSGQAVNVTKRIIKTGTKQISREAAMNISVQFFVNFVVEALNTPNASGVDIAVKAFSDVDFGSAVWSGIINYSSLTIKEKTYFDCTYDFLKKIEEKGVNIDGILSGGLNCSIILGTRYSLKYLRNTQAIKELAKALSDAKKYDDIILKLSEWISEDDIIEFIEILSENGIKKGVESIWTKE